jgi:hypothetical protein
MHFEPKYYPIWLGIAAISMSIVGYVDGYKHGVKAMHEAAMDTIGNYGKDPFINTCKLMGNITVLENGKTVSYIYDYWDDKMVKEEDISELSKRVNVAVHKVKNEYIVEQLNKGNFDIGIKSKP